MKPTMIAGMIVLAFAADGAMAACSGNGQIKNNGNTDVLTPILSGNTACATRGGDRWQEEHHPGGVLKDYKKGPNDKVDPTKQVGTWAVSGNGANTAVTYSYTGGSSNSYTVWDNGGGSYSLCGAGGMDVTLKPGTGVGCP